MLLDELRQDLRFGLRGLARSPAFTATAVLVLALAIGANSAVFSLINMVLLKPLVLERPEELTGVYNKDTSRPDTFRAFSYPDYLDLRDSGTVFESLAVFKPTLVGLAGDDATRRVFAQTVSSNYFATLGVPPASDRR